MLQYITLLATEGGIEMAKVTSFMICDSIQQQPLPTLDNPNNTVFHLINPLQVLVPYSIPGMYSFSISIGLNEFDTDIAHTLDLYFMTPHNDPVSSLTSIQIPSFPENIQNIPKEYRSIFFNTDLRNVVIKEAGIYKIKIDLDSSEIGLYTVPVCLGSHKKEEQYDNIPSNSLSNTAT